MITKKSVKVKLLVYIFSHCGLSLPMLKGLECYVTKTVLRVNGLFTPWSVAPRGPTEFWISREAWARARGGPGS